MSVSVPKHMTFRNQHGLIGPQRPGRRKRCVGIKPFGETIRMVIWRRKDG
jgi:hypothetical protein